MVLKRLLQYLKPHGRSLIYAFILLFTATGADVAGPLLIKIFIDDYLTPRQFDREALIMLGAGYLGLIIVSVICHYNQTVSFNKVALKIIRQLRIDVFAKTQRLGLEVFDKTPAGQLVSRITNDTEAIKELFVSVLSAFVQNTVLLIGIFIALFSLDRRLALLAMALLPLVFILVKVYRALSAKTYRIQRKKLAQLNARLNESLQGMNIIQAMRQEKRFRAEIAQINDDYYQAALRNIKLDGLLARPAVRLLYTFTLVGVLAAFGVTSLSSPVEVGVVYAFVSYLERFIEPLNTMLQRLSQFQQALVAAERVFELLDDERIAPGQEKNSVLCDGESGGEPDSNGQAQAGSRQDEKDADVRNDGNDRNEDSGGSDGNVPEISYGLVEFRNVSFAYDGSMEVLRDVSFSVKPGQTVAFVGHTGSGKSTVANLLLRFYRVTKGGILIDGIPLSAYRDEELRRNIGLVLQDPFLFVGDIEKNISMDRPGLTLANVRRAAEFVQAGSFIEKLPQGYSEPVGERGATLSSGQRQLLCFARTVAGNPKILVLDEATASVDTETEGAIQLALAQMRKGRSTIAIAHRLSTIQDADLILVLYRGKIVERGTHAELLAKEGLYHKMYLLQQGNGNI